MQNSHVFTAPLVHWWSLGPHGGTFDTYTLQLSNTLPTIWHRYTKMCLHQVFIVASIFHSWRRLIPTPQKYQPISYEWSESTHTDAWPLQIDGACYTYVCYVMRAYCPEIFLHLHGCDVRAPRTPQIWQKKYISFSYFGFKLKNKFQIASVFDMYIDIGERIAGSQDRPSLIIEDPLRAPQIAQTINCFYILANIWKTVSPCCTYVTTVMRSAFADISVPLVPLDFM